jgi:membrane-associated phospholipid phosphatase
VVVWLQASGNGLFDALARFMHFAGGIIFYMALLALVFWAINRRVGLRLVMVTLLASLTAEGLKQLFATPRPHIAHPEVVTPLVEQTGYGMPSGHTLMALAFMGYVALWLRDRRFTIFAVIYVLVMGWARMYAGVHYPQDVIGGLVFGGLLLALFHRYEDALLDRWNALNTLARLAVIVAGSGLAVLVSGASESGLTVAGILLGMGGGLQWEVRAVRFEPGGSLVARGVCFAGGLALALALYAGLSALFEPLTPESVWRVVRYATIGLAVSAVWPWISVQVGLTGQMPAGEIAG